MDDLTHLKVGDPVICTNYNGYTRRLLKVTKVTKTMVMVGRHRYRRNNGQTVGSDYYGGSCELVTPEALQAIKEQNQRLRLQHAMQAVHQINLRHVPVDQYEALTNALEAAVKLVKPDE